MIHLLSAFFLWYFVVWDVGYFFNGPKEKIGPFATLDDCVETKIFMFKTSKNIGTTGCWSDSQKQQTKSRKIQR